MTPRTRNLIGYWIQSLKDEEFCAPQEVVGALPPDVRTKLADYLDAGDHDFFSQMGYSWCRFCGATGKEMGSRELTDGFWVWPEGLSHYVRAHGIILPEEFVADALAQPRPRHLNPFRALGPVSLDYWRDWCASHRSPALLERLRRARAEADLRAPGVVQDYFQGRVSEEIARHGQGDERCMFAACDEKVLRGMKLCARHVVREDPDLIASSCYVISPELLA